jgi:hypothetical protein
LIIASRKRQGREGTREVGTWTRWAKLNTSAASASEVEWLPGKKENMLMAKFPSMEVQTVARLRSSLTGSSDTRSFRRPAVR